MSSAVSFVLIPNAFKDIESLLKGIFPLLSAAILKVSSNSINISFVKFWRKLSFVWAFFPSVFALMVNSSTVVSSTFRTERITVLIAFTAASNTAVLWNNETVIIHGYGEFCDVISSSCFFSKIIMLQYMDWMNAHVMLR